MFPVRSGQSKQGHGTQPRESHFQEQNIAVERVLESRLGAVETQLLPHIWLPVLHTDGRGPGVRGRKKKREGDVGEDRAPASPPRPCYSEASCILLTLAP